MTPEEFRRLKGRLEELERESARSEGGLAKVMEDLEQDHGCHSVDEAKERLESLDDGIRKAKTKLERAQKTFEKKWGERL